MEKINNKIEIFVVDRVKYSNCGETGIWVTLPLHPNELQSILYKNNIGILKGDHLILDVEITEISKALDVNEFTGIFDLNSKLNKLGDLDDKLEEVIALINNGFEFDTVLKRIDDIVSFDLATGRLLNENEKIGYGYIESLGGFDNISDNEIDSYFDEDDFKECFYINNQYEAVEELSTEMKRDILKEEAYYFNYDKLGENLAINMIVTDNKAIAQAIF